MKRFHAMPFGAAPAAGGSVGFRLWAPAARRVDLLLRATPQDPAREFVMEQKGEGWFELNTREAAPGSRYRYRIDGSQESPGVPDPASRHNPNDVHGDSEVTDPAAFDWNDADWTGLPWHEAVVYELHVGTFTAQGGYRGVESRLEHLRTLGVTFIELMPLADFPGRRNWGYDGVLPYAPDASYGHPDDLKRLVQSAHAAGMGVLLDVVYNHFGPEGNYLHSYAPQFFTDRHQTPWGAAMNFDSPGSRTVRDFFIHNALYWLEEFHFDGLRFDAVHAIPDESRPDLLSELAARVREGPGARRHVHLVLENDLNQATRLTGATERKGYDAQWNDDFHHACHVLLSGETDGYYADYAGAPAQMLARCLAEGFAYQGEASAFRGGEKRGERSAHLPPQAFVCFLQNHDQVGNRAFGERLTQLAAPEALQAAAAIMLLAPSPPMLFMGEEFGASSPFQFFCDFEPELARAVSEGRRREFAAFERFRDPKLVAEIPDPGATETFARSRLDWSSLEQEPHAQWLACYRSLLALRRAEILPLLARGIAQPARHRSMGERGLEVEWSFRSGQTLALRANLGPHALSDLSPLAADVRILYASQEGPPNALPAWSVMWTCSGASRGQ